MMRFLEAKGKAPKTVNERRTRIHTLWKWLASRGYLRLFPTTDRMPEPAYTPRAHTADELRRLFAAARELDGGIGPVRASDWWSALLAVLWNTGERIGAVLDLRWDMIDPATGLLVIPAVVRKGQRKDAHFMLWTSTLSYLRAIREPERELVFPFPLDRASFYHRWRRLLQHAGLPTGHREGPHKLRRSHASWLAAGGGDAVKALGHSSGYTTERSYLDPAIGLKPVALFRPWEDEDDTEDVA